LLESVIVAIDIEPPKGKMKSKPNYPLAAVVRQASPVRQRRGLLQPLPGAR
jgi:hypothetical protein